MKSILGIVVIAGIAVLLGCAQPADEPQSAGDNETIATEDFESGGAEGAVTGEVAEEEAEADVEESVEAEADDESAEEHTP